MFEAIRLIAIFTLSVLMITFCFYVLGALIFFTYTLIKLLLSND